MSLNKLLGTKIGMTRVFDEKGNIVPVTVISAGPCYVVRTKNIPKDGYTAVQIGYREKTKNLIHPEKVYFEKQGVKPVKYLKEVRVPDITGFQAGQEIKVDIFTPGELVDIRGVTKGLGTAGVMKRYGFRGGPAAHGQSDRARARGASGSQRPQRVLKGTRMAGRTGNEFQTIKNLRVVKSDAENNILLVRGAVPGVRKGLLVISKTGK